MVSKSIVAVSSVAMLLAGCSHVQTAGRVATGITAHQLCSAVFLGGADPAPYYKEAVVPFLGPASVLISHKVDTANRSVSARSITGLESRAVDRGELGCLVIRGKEPARVDLTSVSRSASLLAPWPSQNAVSPANAELAKALDRAFTEPGKKMHRGIKAIVVLHKGQIVAERYAPGIGVHTRLHGWSMTKSVTNALLGRLVQQGRLDMFEPAPVPEWSNPQDPRHQITPDHLLRMVSGLDLGQTFNNNFTSALDLSVQAEFAERDIGSFSARARLIHPPGQVWAYADGNTMILSRILRDAVGGDARSVYAFARQALLDPLGMEDAVLELDATGTPYGGSHMWASARDWTRLGQLFAQDGMAGNQRLLPEGWVDYSARMTPAGDYIGQGAGFWTNRGHGFGPDRRTTAGMPADAFMARGSQGNFVVIIPSKQLVITQIGISNQQGGDIDGLLQLVRETIAALKL
jgi:CubicO group peptidase (beta-lactamase class C family)